MWILGSEEDVALELKHLAECFSFNPTSFFVLPCIHLLTGGLRVYPTCPTLPRLSYHGINNKFFNNNHTNFLELDAEYAELERENQSLLKDIKRNNHASATLDKEIELLTAHNKR